MTATSPPVGPIEYEYLPKQDLSWTNIVFMSALHAIALWAVINFAVFAPPSAIVIWMGIGLFLFTGFGITMGFHRRFTHDSFKCARPLKWVLAIAGSLGVEGQLIGWVADHKNHHKFSDKPRWQIWEAGGNPDFTGYDPHTPYEYNGLRGLLYAHMGWLFIRQRNAPSEVRRLERDSFISWISQPKVYVGVLVIRFLVPTLIAGNAGFLMGVLSAVCLLHVTWVINSLTHRWGTKVPDENGMVNMSDNSFDNVALAILTLGESYHNEHHIDPASAYHGRRWFDLDLTKWLIITLAMLRVGNRRLVWDVCKPRGLLFNEAMIKQPKRHRRPKTVRRPVVAPK